MCTLCVDLQAVACCSGNCRERVGMKGLEVADDTKTRCYPHNHIITQPIFDAHLFARRENPRCRTETRRKSSNFQNASRLSLPLILCDVSIAPGSVRARACTPPVFLVGLWLLEGRGGGEAAASCCAK